MLNHVFEWLYDLRSWTIYDDSWIFHLCFHSSEREREWGCSKDRKNTKDYIHRRRMWM